MEIYRIKRRTITAGISTVLLFFLALCFLIAVLVRKIPKANKVLYATLLRKT